MRFRVSRPLDAAFKKGLKRTFFLSPFSFALNFGKTTSLKNAFEA